MSVMSEVMYAVASDGAEIKSITSNHAARASFFLLFDASGDYLEALTNPFSDISGPAAPQVAQFLAEKGISKLIAGRFGHKFVSELESKEIGYLELKGTAESVIKNLL